MQERDNLKTASDVQNVLSLANNKMMHAGDGEVGYTANSLLTQVVENVTRSLSLTIVKYQTLLHVLIFSILQHPYPCQQLHF